MAKEKVGATGEFPRGKIRPDDEGGLTAGISTDAKGNIIIDFGKAITWVAMPKADATRLAVMLLRAAGVKVETRKDG